VITIAEEFHAVLPQMLYGLDQGTAAYRKNTHTLVHAVPSKAEKHCMRIIGEYN
jgi:hypothetical protein